MKTLMILLTTIFLIGCEYSDQEINKCSMLVDGYQYVCEGGELYTEDSAGSGMLTPERDQNGDILACECENFIIGQ